MSKTRTSDGRGLIVGTIVNPAGLTLAKTIPASGARRFADPGFGASPTWHGFAIDQTGIAFTDDISVIGDQRVRIDVDALRVIDDGLAWAPGVFFDQDGNPVPACTRGTLGRVEQRLAKAGLSARIGHEIEFLLVDPAGDRLPGNCGRNTDWQACSSMRVSSATRWPRWSARGSGWNSSIPNTV